MVVVLTICLILALVAGVVETCIASYCIRRARRAEKKVRRFEEEAEANKERYDYGKKKITDLANLVVECSIKPFRACYLNTVKKIRGAENKKAKIEFFTDFLYKVRNQATGDENYQYLTQLVQDLNAIPVKEEKVTLANGKKQK